LSFALFHPFLETCDGIRALNTAPTRTIVLR
jgi:hypothetical protein